MLFFVNCIPRKEDHVTLTSIVLVIVSIALIIMSVTFAVTSRALFMERRKNSELSKKIVPPPRIEVLKLAEPRNGYKAEYDILVDNKVIQTIGIPEGAETLSSVDTTRLPYRTLRLDR